MAAIAVLGGTGQQGRGIAQRLSRAGHRVIVGSRDPARAAGLIAEWPAGLSQMESADYGSAIAQADTVVLAVPFDVVSALVEQHAPQFRAGALVLDVTVPLSFAGGNVRLLDLPEGSAAEHIRSRLPAAARLATAFKTLPAHALNQIDRPLDCDEFICGDSAEARTAARAIVESIAGLRAIDLGPLTRARSIEHLTLIAVAVNRRQKIHAARFRMVGL